VIGALVFLLFKLKLGEDGPGVFGFLPYAAWGGLGGAVAALFGLYLHAAKRDFDRGYLPFYFLKPVLGVVLGPVMYLFVRAGLMATTGTPSTVNQASSSDFLLLAAFTVGFGERFTVRLIDRVASAIFGEAEAPRQGPQRPPAEAAAALATTVAAAKGDLALEVTGIDANQGLVKLLRDGAEVQPEKVEVKGGKFALLGLAAGEYEVQVQATEEAEWRPTSPAKVKVEAGKETPFTLEVK
jgi:hypothetical protein